ncbi:uncharacterized protein LODBEIA_P32470 [Lodderomyces beijingensis]|uniref:Carbohydrate kinase PfkB domain-containing protein n=1 Tax=Lodderomyces beijingensis TaxID=1775926 RepID=A0ABP0ZLJ1_9ASCO
MKKNVLRLSQEVKNALNLKKPVVSLESTIISHGLPYPRNVDMALEVEEILRDSGVTPATCAFLKGQPHVGLTQSDLLIFAEEAAKRGGDKGVSNVSKVSRRDIGYVMANQLYGGTTISSTMILSHLAGIKFFATGGLGGVHRDVPGETSMDVSADLTELGRTPVSVICAGPKSVLDVGRTLEFLETQGVFVGTYNEDKLDAKDLKLPGFYCRESQVPSPFGFDSFEEAAQMVYAQNSLDLQSGNVFCIPPPKDTALDSSFISEIIESANEEARAKNVSGKHLTPFLLARIAEKSHGKSVDCNVSLVKNNARAAAEIAKAYHAISPSEVSHQPIIENTARTSSGSKSSPPSDTNSSILVVGSVALDTAATLGSDTKMHDSNIGTITNSIGGVGYNIALASKYIYPSTRFMSRIGKDVSGDTISSEVQSQMSSVLTTGEGRSAQYVCTHDSQGELIVACADMSIIEEAAFADDVIRELNRSNPKIVVLDCNLSSESLNRIISQRAQRLDGGESPPSVIIEPTSYVKAQRLGQVQLAVFPHNAVKLITPTVQELSGMFNSMSRAGKFECLDHWFPVVDAMSINGLMREKLARLDSKYKLNLVSSGVLQQSFHLLPYFQNIIVKLGSKGVLSIGLAANIHDLKSIPTTSPYLPASIITNDPNSKIGVVVEYYPVAKENENLQVVNVTGAGDTLVGFLAGKLAQVAAHSPNENWLNSEILSCEQVWNRWEHIHKAQSASGLTLQSTKAVSPEIGKL